MPSSPVYAALDLGSNNFHLLIATFNADKLIVIDDIKSVVQLAAGLQPDKTLCDETIQSALNAIKLFADRLQQVDRRYLRVIGTSTLRQAKNADVFLEQAEAILQCPIDIISGIEEARLTFLGVSKDYSPSAKRLIVDIGGGSTECVVGQQEAEQLNSLHIGCVLFAKRYFADGKINRSNYQQALLAARTEVQVIAKDIADTQWQEAVGSSGTIRCIQQILAQQYQQPLITLDGIERLAHDLTQIGDCEKLDFASLSDNRRNVLPAGLAILHALFIELAIQQMQTTDQAIREGIIYELDGRTCHLGRREKTIAQLQFQYHVDLEQAANVHQTANLLLSQIHPALTANQELLDLLTWAAQLHEIGLPINHSGYHRHGAYIIENSSMPGFSQQMQQSIAYLIGNHRRKIRQQPAHYGVTQNRYLLIALRLAWLFCRRRGCPQLPPELTVHFGNNTLRLGITADWLLQFPLISADLQQELKYLDAIGVKLIIDDAKVANHD